MKKRIRVRTLVLGLLVAGALACASTGTTRDPAALEAAGDLDGACHAWADAFEASGRRDADAAARGGLAALARGDLPLAADLLGAAEALRPGDPGVRRGLARVAFVRGDFGLAEQLLTPLVAAAPDDLTLRLDLARVAFAAMRFELAAEHAQAVVTGGGPGAREARVLLGRAREGQGHVDEAEAAFRDAIQHAPDDPTGYYHLGRLYDRLRMPSSAIAALEKAVALSPQFVEALRDLGSARLHAGDTPGAIQSLEAARAVAGDDPAVLNNLGIAYRLADRPQDARAVFEQAMGLGIESRVVPVNLSDTLVKLGEFARARDVLVEAHGRGLLHNADLFELQKILVLMAYHQVVCAAGAFDADAFRQQLAQARQAAGLPPDTAPEDALRAVLADLESKVILDEANQRCLSPSPPDAPAPR